MSNHKIPGHHSDFSPMAVVITPTAGTRHLKTAMESVERQLYPDVLHLIVVDGEQYEDAANRIIEQFDPAKHRKIVLPFNTAHGLKGNKFNGHRIYAACSYLVNSRYVFFLDEDNWYDADHISTLIALIEREGLDWAYSLRKIYTENGEFVTHDDCENLGRWPPYSGAANLVDTSCYAFKREILTTLSHAWYHPLGADRVFYNKISAAYGNYRTSSRYTVNYRLHTRRAPTEAFFLEGNQYMLRKYGNVLPWRMNP